MYFRIADLVRKDPTPHRENRRKLTKIGIDKYKIKG